MLRRPSPTLPGVVCRLPMTSRPSPAVGCPSLLTVLVPRRLPFRPPSFLANACHRMDSYHGVVGERGSSRSGPRGPARGLQGSGQLVCVLRVVPGTYAATKGLTGFACEIRLEGVPAAGGLLAAGFGRGLFLVLRQGPGGPARNGRYGRLLEMVCLCDDPGGSFGRNGYGLAAANCGMQCGCRQSGGPLTRFSRAFWLFLGGFVPRNKPSPP
jgi:hypothetical protein